jgi:hypothetical protein
VGEGKGGRWSRLLRWTAWECVGGERVVGKFSFGGGQISLRSVIPYFINSEYFARVAQIENNSQCQWG